MGKTPQTTNLYNVIDKWISDPVSFVETVIRPPKPPTTQQKTLLTELGKLVRAKIKYNKGIECSDEEKSYASKKGVSVMSGQGTGKDACASWIIWWFLVCFPNPKILATAPTSHQLRDVLWSEIAKWRRNSISNDVDLLEKQFVHNSEKVYLKERDGKEWYAVARTCNAKSSPEEQAETLAGLHEDYMMYIVDEASGVPDPVFKPIEGSMTGICNFAVVIFNPTKTTGFALDTQFKNKDAWVALQWNSEHSEIVAKDHIDYMARKYGRESNTYRVRVLGLPPKSDDSTLIPWDWVQAAIDREIFVNEKEPVKIGVDVGGGVDKSVILCRKGYKIQEILCNDTPDTMLVAGWVMKYVNDANPDGTFIDLIGIGRGVYDRIREMGYDVTGVNTSNNPQRIDKYVKLRDELWWKMRELFEKGIISIPNDEELIAELTSIKYDFDSKGRVKIESKKDMRMRGVSSPNKADALVLTLMYDDIRPYTKSRIDSRRKTSSEYDLITHRNSWMSM